MATYTEEEIRRMTSLADRVRARKINEAADAQGRFPDALKNDADWAYFQAELNRSAVTVLGRLGPWAVALHTVWLAAVALAALGVAVLALVLGLAVHFLRGRRQKA